MVAIFLLTLCIKSLTYHGIKVCFNAISEGKSLTSLRERITIENCYLPQRHTQKIYTVTKRKLQWASKSHSEVVNTATPQEMI